MREDDAIDVQRLIDDRPISRAQIHVFLLCALVILLDGIDYQLMGLVAPSAAPDLGITPARLGFVFGSGPLGAFAGGLVCGPLADRFGRKALLIVTTFLFGAATFATAFVDGFGQLIAIRFVTGVGLGGAVPACVALVSEYAPARRRATLVGLLWAAFPLGGMTGGFLNAALIRHFDWRELFLIWGVIPMAVSAVLVLLPESIQFLLLRGRDQGRVRGIVERITGAVHRGGAFVSTEKPLHGAPVGNLFRDGRAAATIPLWFVYFILFGSLTVLSTWSPVLLTQQGLAASTAALVMGAHGLGSFIGSGSAGRLLERFGVRSFVLPVVALGSLSIVVYGHAADAGQALLMLASFGTGLTLGAGSSSTVALAALTYPTAVRSTGSGWGMAMGRAGSVAGPILAGLLVASGFGVSDLFTTVGIVLLIPVPFLWLLGAYRGRLRSEAAPQTAASPQPVAAPEADAAAAPTRGRYLQQGEAL